MSQFVESLCRLYQAERISKDWLDKLLSSHKINQQEYDYVISVKNAR